MIGIMEVSAIITALSSIGIFGFGVDLWRRQRRTDRILFGEESVDHWDGLVGEVQANKQALESEGIR